jgi:2-methylcitrate dehydratase PrpD
MAFEGPAGYLECFARGRDAGAGIGAELGRRWGILEVTFKPFPVCAFNQAPALLAVRVATDADLRAEDVDSVVVRMNPREATYPGMPYAGPFDGTAQTLMSTRFCVAAALANRHVDFATLQRFTDPVLNDLVARIETVPEPGRPPKTASMTLRTRDGRVHEDAIEDSLPLLSWTSDEVRANARRLRPESHLDAAALDALIAAVDGLDDGGDLSGLVHALAPVAV